MFAIFAGGSFVFKRFPIEDAMPIEADGNVRGITPVEFRVMARVLRFVN